MSKKQLKDLYKAKPELVEEHRRLVNVLRSGSPSEQKKEAAKQLKELKEMLKKEELEKKISLKGALTAGLIGASAMAGNAKASPESDLHSQISKLNVMGEYHTPKTGSRAILKEPSQLKADSSHPTSLYSRESTSGSSTGRFHGPDAEKAKALLQNYDTATKSDKEDDLEKRCWEGYKPVPGKKPYEKGSCEPVSKEETLKVEKNGQWSLGKSNSVKPFGQNIYDATANITRKKNRTGEEISGTGPNTAVKRYTGTHGTAREQADRQASQDKQKNKKQPVKIVDFSAMTPEHREKASKLIAQGVDPSTIEGVKFKIQESSKKSKEST